jgi:hypothetical protein
MSDTPSYDPTPQPPAASGGLPPALANISGGTLLWVQVVGGVLAAISTFLPWVTVSSGFYSASANGFDDGIWGFLVLLLGLAVAALAFIKLRNMQVQGLDKLPAQMPLILSSILALIAVFRWIYILTNGGSSDLGALEAFGVDVSSGIGIWLVLIGSLAAFAAVLLPTLKNRKA